MSHYFAKPFRSFGRNINLKVDLSNYATKTDLKNVPHVDTSSFALKTKFSYFKNKIPSVSNLVKKQTVTQKLLKLKRNLLTIIMTNILQL